LLALKGHTDWVNAVACNPDGRLLAAGCGDGAVRVWAVVAPVAKR
jgi:WD40 repeat protein